MKEKIIFLLLIVYLSVYLSGCSNTRQAEVVDPADTNIYYLITGVGADETVMTVEDNSIPAEMYFYWVAFNCSAVEYQINRYYDYYGRYEKFVGEDGDINWDEDFTETQTLGEYTLAQADELAGFYAAVENIADRYHVVLSEEAMEAIEKDRQSMENTLGGEDAFDDYLKQMGLSSDNYTRINTVSSLLDELITLAGDPESDLYLPPEKYGAYEDSKTGNIFHHDNDGADDSRNEAEKAAEEDLLERYVTELLEEYLREHTPVKSEVIAELDAGEFYRSYIRKIREMKNQKAIDELTD